MTSISKDNDKKYEILEAASSSIQEQLNVDLITFNKGNTMYTLYDYLRSRIPEMINNYSLFLSKEILRNPPPLYFEAKKIFKNLSLEDFFIGSLIVLDEILPGTSKDYTSLIGNFYNKNISAIKTYKASKKQTFIEYIIPENYTVSLMHISANLEPYIKSWDPEYFMKTSKLTPLFPFIGMISYKNKESKFPQVKAHVSINQDILYNWVFKDNKVREYKGVIIKVKNSDTFQTININRFTPKISMKIQGSGKQCKVLIMEAKECLSKFIKFYNGEYVSPETIDVNVSSISVKVPFRDKTGVNYSIDLEKCRTYLIEWGEYKLDKSESSIKIIVDKASFTINEGSFTINSINNSSDILSFISLFTRIISYIEGKYAVSLFKKDVNTIIKITKDITNVNPVDCQKNRRVKRVSKGVNTVEYNKDHFICNNKEYPFFGFTAKGNICCFKKPQIDKPIYLLKMGQKDTFKYKEKDFIILSKTPIVTDKPVPEFRIGVINGKALRYIKGYNSEIYYRLGNPSGTLISAVSYALQRNIQKTLVENATEPMYRSLLRGSFFYQMDFITWKKCIEVSDYKHPQITEEVLIDFIEKSLKIQLQMISIEIKRVKTTVSSENSKYNQCYDSAVTILKYIRKEGLFYEPIIAKLSKSQIQYITKSNKCSKITHPYIIKQQYINNYNKVEYITTDKGVLPISILNLSSSPDISIPMITGYPTKGKFSLQSQLIYLKELDITPLFQVISSKGVKALIVQKGNKTGIVPVIIEKTPVKDIPLSYTFYDDNINTILDSVYEIETITWSRYYKELYERFQLLLSDKVYKEVKIIVKNTDLSYNSKFEKIRTILKGIYNEKNLLFKEIGALDTVKTLPKIRYTCIDEGFSVFCQDKKLIISKHISEAFIDKITTLFLIGYYPYISKNPKERKKIHDYFIRPSEVIYTNKEDYYRLQKSQKNIK